MPIRVVLIDADADAQFILAALLTANGFQVRSATTADEGKRLSCDADVVILEYEVPPFSGICLVEVLRALPATVLVPLIVWTSQVFPQMQERVEACGALFRPKPCPPATILDDVRRLTDGLNA